VFAQALRVFGDLQFEHLHRPEHLEVLSPSLDDEVALPGTDRPYAASSHRRTESHPEINLRHEQRLRVSVI
jgi:hypothetical protein